MTRSVRRSRAAFTLAEVAVAAAAACVLMVSISGIYTLAVGRWGWQVSRAKAIQAADAAMERMCREIRRAVSCTVLTLGGGNTVGEFVLPNNTDSGGNYIPQRAGAVLSYVAGRTVRFYRSDLTGMDYVVGGTIVWRESRAAGSSTWMWDTAWSLESQSPARGRCANVVALDFTTAGQPAHTVLVTLSVQIAEGPKTSTYTVSRQVYMENHN